MKIHAIACGARSETIELGMLHQLWLSSVPRLHDWTEDPREADLIFLTNAQQQWGAVLERESLPRRYPEKCFALSEQWEPPFLLAGIYANAPRTSLGRGRFRSGSYALHHPDFRNPFIESFTYDRNAAPRTPDLLASFLGRDCHPVRKKLFSLGLPREKFLVEDTSTFDAFTHSSEGKRERQKQYFESCLRSKFILCPRGAGPNSIRLFEALKLGIAPVIISDAWIPCEGPRWNEFALFVAEKDIAAIESVLDRAEPDYQRRGTLAREAYEAFFSQASYFNYLVSAAESARRARVIPERLFVSLWPVQRLLRKARRRSRRLLSTLHSR